MSALEVYNHLQQVTRMPGYLSPLYFICIYLFTYCIWCRVDRGSGDETFSDSPLFSLPSLGIIGMTLPAQSHSCLSRPQGQDQHNMQGIQSQSLYLA